MTLRVGGAIKLKATFTAENVKTDPTTIILEVKDPSGNVDTYTYSEAEITKDSQGVYSKIVEFDETGWWSYEWHGTGTVIVVDGRRFRVDSQLI